MKSCPDCNRTFEDTFTFCLVDGSILSAPFAPGSGPPDTTKASNEAPPTEVLSNATPSINETAPSAVPPPAPTIRASYQPSPPVSSAPAAEAWAPAPAERKPNTLVWVIGGIALLLVVVIAVMVFRSGSSPTTTANHVSNNMAATNMAATSSSTATPDLGKVHRDRGSILQTEKRYAEAEVEYREAIRLNPRDLNAHANLAQSLSRQKKFDEAVIEYRETLRLKPDLDPHWAAAIHYNIGKALYDAAKYSEAEAEYREAIRLDANLGMAHSNLGATLFQMKRYSEAEPELREAVRLSPNEVAPHHDLAAVLEVQGKTAESKIEYAKAAQLKKQATP